MAVVFRFEVDGVVQMARAIERFADDVQDLRPAWPAVLRVLRLAMAERFAREGAHGSARWAPLSPAYAAWKARHYPGRGILVLTGTMRDSLTQQTPMSVVIEEPLSLTFGTRVPYAIYHQRGTRRMPRREVVRLAETDKRDIMREVQRYLVQRAKASGLAAVA